MMKEEASLENHESPQMMVLGSSGEERNEFFQGTTRTQDERVDERRVGRHRARSKHRSQVSQASENNGSSSIIGRIFSGKKKSEEESNETNFSRPTPDSSDPGDSLSDRFRPLNESFVELDCGRGLDPSAGSNPKLSVSTEENVLQQDCSFFYRDMEDQTIQRSERRTPRFSSLLRQSSPLEAPSSMYTTTLSSPALLQTYRNRYDQLNQEAPREEEYDLELGENVTADSNTSTDLHRIVANDTAEYSSLFYVRHGKLLMKLPQDHIRLAMEPDLEPGILSVEQRRTVDEEEALSIGAGRPDQDRQPLHYVLTVPDDLYRRVVSDLSNGIFRPYWGMTASHDHKVDIRVAVVVLIIVMFVLWVNVMVWPHQ